MKFTKFLCFATVLLVFSINPLWSQFRFGLRGGVSANQVDVNQLLVANQQGSTTFALAFDNTKYDLHAGIFFRFGKGVYFQPEVLYNWEKVSYRITDEVNPQNPVKFADEEVSSLLIPALFGLKLGPFRIQAGPMGKFFINSLGTLKDLDGYQPAFRAFALSYQAGIGLDLFKSLILDFKYEGRLNDYGDHLVFFGNTYDFDERPAKYVASLGFFF